MGTANIMATILIIDDEKSIRNVLRDILQHEGYQVEEAADGEQGIKMFQSKNFDLVLCDIKMPKMDGMEVLQQIMAINSEVPVIMISGHGTIENAVDAVKKGAYDFISKPPDLNRLLITLRNALDKNTLVRETKILKKKVRQPLRKLPPLMPGF
jgi:DNA-binding NtrC family response regulator